LGVQLLDEEGNNASSTLYSMAAQAKDIDSNAYALLNPHNFSVGSDGTVLWCQLYSTKTIKKNISIGVAVGAIVTWLAGSFNVGSSGPPAVIATAPVANPLVKELLPGQIPPPISFSISDAAGNSIDKITKTFVIRIFVQPRRRSVSSRMLLQSSEETASSMCPSVTYVNVLQGHSGLISVSPPLLCTAGENDIFYSVGEMAGDSFLPSYNFELATVVTVLPGPCASFTLNSPTQFDSLTYSLIQGVAIHFRDKGMNIVSGTARMSLRTATSGLFLHPSHEFEISSNNASKVILPPFFAYSSGWNAVNSSVFLRISIVGNVSSSSSNVVLINLTATCLPGSRLYFPSGDSVVALVYLALLAGRNVTCVSCAKPEYGSWFIDAPECLTLKYTNAPNIVHSGRALTIDTVAVMTDSGKVAQYATGWSVTMKLQRAQSIGSAVNAILSIQQGRSLPTTTVPAYVDEPASDYAWVLQLRSVQGGGPSVFNLTIPLNVTVLDFSPVSLRITPSALSHEGHELITVTGFFPLSFPKYSSFYGAVLPILRNSSCFFKASASSKTMSLTVSAFNDTKSSIVFICGPLRLGDISPPLLRWNVMMLLSDGRESEESSVESYCPTLSFIKNASGRLECMRCPQDRSASTRINSLGEQSCVCSARYYGSFGEGCVACPKNVEGFNCVLSNQSRPMIRAGFYIDYSLMGGCSEYSPKCGAIIKCPNPAACPGTTEKECVNSAEECYDSESFGCTACCTRYYMENFVCRPCPESQLPLILSLCILALILFAVFSATFDFPPLLSVAKSLRIFLSCMQGFVSIRLLAVSWPPIILQMFDFTRYFTFNFDVIRPECTVDYTPLTKLVFVLLGPLACALFIIKLGVIYILCKCCRISKMLQEDTVKSIHNKNFYETAWSVAQCVLTTSFCLKFSNSRMMVDGALWNALSPALTMRTNTQVLRQKVRRNNTVVLNAMHAASAPSDWIRMKVAVEGVEAEPEFARSVKLFRRLISSALSIFVFTFQSSIESAFSTFDCKTENDVRFLRSNPKFKCSMDDEIYFRMVICTIIGIIFYCALLPAITIITLRSRWSREMFMHDSLAYNQLFGFLTSMYSKSCALWELVACVRKVVFVVIPILVSTEALVQSVSMFCCLIIYTFMVLQMQPMASSILNQIEALSCISVVISCFSSIFFVIEYKGSLVLSGTSRNLAGLLLVIVCAFCMIISLKLMWNDFSSMVVKTQDVLYFLQREANSLQGSC
jgi:hypothetical protein